MQKTRDLQISRRTNIQTELKGSLQTGMGTKEEATNRQELNQSIKLFWKLENEAIAGQRRAEEEKRERQQMVFKPIIQELLLNSNREQERTFKNPSIKQETKTSPEKKMPTTKSEANNKKESPIIEREWKTE